MSFHSMPPEVQFNIIRCSLNWPLEEITCPEIKKWGKDFRIIVSLNKMYHKEFQLLFPIKRIFDFVNKYNVFNKEFENIGQYWPGRKINLRAAPQLLDALSTGCTLPHAKSTHSLFTPEIENDIQAIVELMPESVHCTLGSFRSRDNVPPLAVACFNVNIPLHIVEFLLKKGANPHATYDVAQEETNILDDLKNNNLQKDRFLEIQTLFSKYGAEIKL